MNVTVSSKGQIVLPAELRKRYGIEAGSKLGIVDLAGSIYLVPLPDDPIKAARGMLKGKPNAGTKALLKERRIEKERDEEEYQRWARGT